ncbi:MULTISPECIES: hypothetical protein [Virgibacillus]|uniref:Uncharacterized protein n=2 Tax=Virgibacillus TaxID=84406 RepID=A0A024QFZ8_9BACI|nr:MULTISPECIES: hypothetical protein [Virgibacillus]EQB39001.1 hypothetical protein M948_01235 [Virgibacillus sp. CM-4]MYL43362.1 hypothetical protein [Virgibacillus massiliensis]GGJ68136.1 hypothetical protein GCM10007111_32440 [Virgibacillus kapii]CDQ41125.1 hypothetical protein BN990_03480 [Virgibacillus massiliensis]
MYNLALLYLACVFAAFGLTNVPVSAVITEDITNFLDIIGGIAMIVFAVATLYIGFKALFQK